MKVRDPDEARRAPLSFNQQGLWFIEQLAPGRGIYDVPGSVALDGPLDRSALREALAKIVRRHEILRSRIAADRGEPYQEVCEIDTIPLPMTDLSEVAASRREARLREEMERELSRPIALDSAPLFRARLLKVSAERHVLLFKLPHIVTDGWSMGVFTDELRRFYTSRVAGEAYELEPLPVQFVDFVRMEREQLRGERLEEHLTFWRDRLDLSSSGLEIRSDRPRPSEPGFAGAHYGLRLGHLLSEQVRSLARRRRCTPFHTLLAAFYTTALSLNGTEEGPVGVTYANRGRVELEGLIGNFVNVLPLSVDLRGDPSFEELQVRVRDEALAISAYQRLPLAKLVRELQPERDLSRNPMFQVVLYYLTPDHNPAIHGYGTAGVDQRMRMGEVEMSTVPTESGFSRFDLALLFWDLSEELRGVVEYSTELFDEATIERVCGQLRATLERATARPGTRLSTLLGFLRERERTRRRDGQRGIPDGAIEKLGTIRRR